MPPEPRRASRVAIVDRAGRILLFRYAPPGRAPFWATPGGGLEGDETYLQAALRELEEELGVAIEEGDLSALPALDEYEGWFLLRTDGLAFSDSLIERHAREQICDRRWWSAEELETAREPVYPEELAALIRALPAPGPEAALPGSVLAGGKLLEYRSWGARDGRSPVLVFLHAGLACASTWRELPGVLARSVGLPAIAYSRAGHGSSEATDGPWGPAFMDREAAVLDELLAVLGVREVILFGHSDGASISLIWAAGAGRGRARVLILEAPHVFCEDVTTASVRASGRAFEDPADELRSKMVKRHRANAEVAFWGWHDAWLHPGFASWSIVDRLSSIACPVLVFQGDADEYGSLAHLELIEANVKGRVERRIVAGGGHAPHKDDLALVTEASRRFILGAA